VKQGPAPADFAWRTEALERGMAACDALVAPSRSFARATAAAHGGVVEPLVVHNGRRPAGPGGEPRERFVFTSGRLWDQGKNLATLDAAVAVAGAPMYAAGPLDGPSPGDRLRPDHLRSLGRLSADEVTAWLRRAPIYASSALYEPFGLGVLEAAQAGCALVLSDIPSFRELWSEAAIFVDPQDPQAFANAFAGLLDDDVHRRRLGDLARHRAERFSVQAMTRGMLGLYGQLRSADRREAAA
jgi:glycogen(starch) synthase